MTENKTVSKFYLEPVGESLIGKVHVPEDVNDFGIILPEQVDQDKGYIEVVAVGDDVDETVSLSAGDLVLRKPYTGTPIKFEDEEYVLLDVEDIAAVIREQ